MWSVVCFLTDNTIDTVPNFWYKNGICSYPNKASVARKYIKRRVNPNVLEFSKFKVEVLHQNVDSYLDARNLAQSLSGMSSNETFNEKQTEKSRRRLFKSTCSEKNLNQISNPPSLSDEEFHLLKQDSQETINGKKTMQQQENNSLTSEASFDNSDEDKTYSPSKKRDFFDLNSDYLVDSYNSDHQPTAKSFVEQMSTSNSVVQSSKLSDQNIIQKVDFVISSSKKKKGFNETLSTPFIENMLTTPVHFEKDNDKSSDRFITRSLTNLKYDVESMQKRLDLLISLQEKTYSFLTQNDCSILNSSAVHHFELTCIDSDDELVHVEDKLLNKEFRTQMISTLKRFMGDSISETVRKILQRLFTDSFLMHYSYIGFKGKRIFSKLQHCAVIFESINKMKNFENIPVKCIEKAIKSWLAQAPQRLKKMSEKMSEKIPSTT